MATHGRGVRRTVRARAGRGDGESRTNHSGERDKFHVGDRVTIDGFHKNYRPTIESIDGKTATVAVREIPNAERVVVSVERLELIS